MGSNDNRALGVKEDNIKMFLSKVDFSNTANVLGKDNFDSNLTLNKMTKLNNQNISTIGNSSNNLKTKKIDDQDLEKLIIHTSNLIMNKMMSYDIKQTINDPEKLSFLTTYIK